MDKCDPFNPPIPSFTLTRKRPLTLFVMLPWRESLIQKNQHF